MTMMPVTTMAMMALSIRRNYQACQNDECDNTKKHGADLHSLLFFLTACSCPDDHRFKRLVSLLTLFH
ncbi:MAG TPA: hypothetical protein VK608_09110, partial [Edaphobacter sp.]|nr:hypothetical protein [Edaphobacter sp.]